jgi:hypothetical protein
MSFSLGGIFNKVVDTFLPAAIGTAFPLSNLVPGLNNFIADKLGDALGGALDDFMKQAGFPQFMIKDVLNLLKDCVQQQKQPCDRSCADEARDKFGDVTQKMIDDLICDFKDMFKKYLSENRKEGKSCEGGKGGKGGCGNAQEGEGEGVSIRELALLVAGLEIKAGDNLKKKVIAAADSLGVATSGKPEDAQKDAEIRKNQFLAQEEAKAEGGVMQVVFATSSGLMKNFIDGMVGLAQKA